MIRPGAGSGPLGNGPTLASRNCASDPAAGDASAGPVGARRSRGHNIAVRRAAAGRWLPNRCNGRRRSLRQSILEPHTARHVRRAPGHIRKRLSHLLDPRTRKHDVLLVGPERGLRQQPGRVDEFRHLDIVIGPDLHLHRSLRHPSRLSQLGRQRQRGVSRPSRAAAARWSHSSLVGPSAATACGSSNPRVSAGDRSDPEPATGSSTSSSSRAASARAISVSTALTPEGTNSANRS